MSKHTQKMATFQFALCVWARSKTTTASKYVSTLHKHICPLINIFVLCAQYEKKIYCCRKEIFYFLYFFLFVGCLGDAATQMVAWRSLLGYVLRLVSVVGVYGGNR